MDTIPSASDPRHILARAPLVGFQSHDGLVAFVLRRDGRVDRAARGRDGGVARSRGGRQTGQFLGKSAHAVAEACDVSPRLENAARVLARAALHAPGALKHLSIHRHDRHARGSSDALGGIKRLGDERVTNQTTDDGGVRAARGDDIGQRLRAGRHDERAVWQRRRRGFVQNQKPATPHALTRQRPQRTGHILGSFDDNVLEPIAE